MLSVSFQGARKLRHILKSKSQRYSLNAAQDVINEAESFALKQPLSEVVVMVIYGDQNEKAFVEELEFGKNHSYINSLLTIVQHTLSSDLFAETSIEAKNSFLNQLSQQLQSENQVQIELPTASNQPLQQAVESQTTQSSITEPAGAEFEPVSEPLVATELTKAPIVPNPKLKRLRHHRRAWPYVVATFVLLMAISIVGFVAATSKPKTTKPPTYTTLIGKKQYLTAAKQFPSKRSDIESTLSEASDTKNLASFVAKYPSDNGKFDLAYLKQQYPQVIALSVKADMNAIRKTMLAVAYVKTNQPDQAAILNVDLKSNKLSLLIALGYVHMANFDEAEKLNQNLKNTSLTKAIDTGRIYQQAIVKYQKDANDKTKSETERKSAAANAQAFEHQLQTLGE